MRILVTSLLFLLLLVSSQGAGAAPAGYPDISHAQLVAALKAHNVFVIDCNPPDIYNQGHVPTAVYYYAVKDRLASLMPKDKSILVVAYCANPY
jgi:rhodanese-related sulfurtransferase